MEKKINSKREYEYDFMRTLAAVAVVCIHTCATRWRSIDVYSTNWVIISVYHTISAFSVPLFFMISGHFCLDTEHGDDAKYIIKKILRLVTAFLFWSLVYAIENCLTADSLRDSWKQILFEFFTGEYHMWFLFAIVCLYLIIPLLKPIAVDDKLCKYFLLLFFAFQLLLPAISNIPHIGIFATEFLKKTQMKFVIGYSGYYLLGSFLSKRTLSKKTVIICYTLGIVGAVYSVVAVLRASRSVGFVDITLAEYLTWNVAAETIAIYVFISRIFKDKSSKVITFISKYSLGIYLSHPLVLWIFSLTGFMPDFINPLIGVPVVTASATVISLLLSMLLRKIPKLGKIIT